MTPRLPMVALAPRAQLCWKPNEGRVPAMAVVVGVETGLLLPGLWNWARAGGIQQLSEWPSIRHSWVQVSEASAKAFWRFTSMAVGEKESGRTTPQLIQQVQVYNGYAKMLQTHWMERVVVLSAVDPQNSEMKWKLMINVSFHLIKKKTAAEHLISIGIPMTRSVYLQYAMNSL